MQIKFILILILINNYKYLKLYFVNSSFKLGHCGSKKAQPKITLINLENNADISYNSDSIFIGNIEIPKYEICHFFIKKQELTIILKSISKNKIIFIFLDKIGLYDNLKKTIKLDKFHNKLEY